MATARFLSFVAPAPAVLPARATLTPCFRFTNSGQATFPPAHHDKQTRPRKFDNNAAEYDGVLCVDTVLGMYGADPAGDADDLLANQEFSTDDCAETDAEYQLDDKAAVYSFHSFSPNNIEYDNDMRNDAAADWLRERGYYQLDGGN